MGPSPDRSPTTQTLTFTLECARNAKEITMDFRDTPDALRLSAAADAQDERR
jgi:hypothetical protein